MAARRTARVAACLALGCLAAACVRTTYVPYSGTADAPGPFDRRVHFEVSSGFYREAPDCAVVLPASGAAGAAAAGIEEAVARHLTTRFGRVIGPVERGRIERAAGLDAAAPSNRRALAAAARCPFLVEVRVDAVGNDYLMVWSERRVGLALGLVRAAGGEPLWQAAHTAARGDGGLPLSPLSVLASAFDAGRFQGDADVMPSLVDDAVRRMVVTLPDTR